MTERSHSLRLRGLGAALVAVLAVSVPVLVDAGPATARPASPNGSAAPYDARLGRSACHLLGRAFASGRGCSRSRCVKGAVPWQRTYGAEACALAAAPKGYGFVATVEARECRALQRVWLGQVNYCASYPDRTATAVADAAQCTGSATVYVLLRETEGAFDECLTGARYAELARLAAEEGTTPAAEVLAHSVVQCADRPGHVFADGRCVSDPSFAPTGGGVLMIGDSLTWRGSDELARLHPAFTVDGEPARPATELASRLAHYRAGHGDPRGLLIELGTVPAPTFHRRDLVSVVRNLPRTTTVMLVLPHYELRQHPVRVTPQSARVDRWMRALARSRKHTCAADWPAYVRAHPGILQDGVHVKHPAEGAWAQWVTQQWGRC